MEFMDILLAIIWIIIGFFIDKIIDTLLKTFRNRKIKAQVRDFHEFYTKNDSDILFTAKNDMHFSKDDFDISVEKNSSFYLFFPNNLLSKLPKSNFSSSDVIPYDITNDKNIMDVINQARESTALDFINKKNGAYFNGHKFGIIRSDGFSRTCDEMERPILTIKLFNTDYFTHCTITNAIKSININRNNFSINSLNENYSWLRTSFGLSIIVILKSSNQIILTHRAKNAAFSENKDWVYVSVTEAFSETDFDKFDNCPSITLCVKRGLKEELGLTTNMYDETSLKFYDMFFEKSLCQDGIVASIELNQNIDFEILQSCYLKAKDSLLETSDFFLIDNNKKSITEYIEMHKDEMRSQTIFSLKCYLAHM